MEIVMKKKIFALLLLTLSLGGCWYGPGGGYGYGHGHGYGHGEQGYRGDGERHGGYEQRGRWER